MSMKTMPTQQHPALLPTPQPLQAHGAILISAIEIITRELLQFVLRQPIPPISPADLPLRDGAEPRPKGLPHNVDVEEDQETDAHEKDGGSNDDRHRHDLGGNANKTTTTHFSF